MTFSDVISLLVLICLVAFIVLACFVVFMVERLSHEDEPVRAVPHLLRATDEHMNVILYRVGMESDTAARHMHTLCRLLDVHYPPSLPTLTDKVKRPEFQAAKKRNNPDPKPT